MNPLAFLVGPTFRSPAVFGVVVGAIAGAGAQQPEPRSGERDAAQQSRRVDGGCVIDVYGLGRRGAATTPEPHVRGVVDGQRVADRPGAGCVRVPCNPHTGRVRIRIEHPVDSAAFAATLQRLRASVPSPGTIGPAAAPGRETESSPEVPRLVARLPARLESVGRLTDRSRVLTLHVGGVRQALSAGDIVCVHESAATPWTPARTLELEVLADAPAAAGDSGRMHVRVWDEPAANSDDVLERLDASDLRS